MKSTLRCYVILNRLINAKENLIENKLMFSTEFSFDKKDHFILVSKETAFELFEK